MLLICPRWHTGRCLWRAQLSCISRIFISRQIKMEQKASNKNLADKFLFFIPLFSFESSACHWWVNYSSSHPVYVLIFSSLPRDETRIGLLLTMAQKSLLLAVKIRMNTPPSVKCSDNSSPLNFLAVLLLFFFCDYSFSHFLMRSPVGSNWFFI